MNHTDTNNISVLSMLRALVPQRQVEFIEALRIAEQQAQRLLRQTAVDGAGPVSEDLLRDLPRIAVEYVAGMPTSGCSFWDSTRKTWVIQVNRDEPFTRQRFTLFHEYKHIVDHGRTDQLYGTAPDADLHAEQAADYFAGCVLMSRPFLKSAWGQGLQTAEQLAARFNVSSVAVRVRLAQIGLVDQPARCTPPTTRRRPAGRGDYFRSYFRQLDPRFGVASS